MEYYVWILVKKGGLNSSQCQPSSLPDVVLSSCKPPLSCPSPFLLPELLSIGGGNACSLLMWGGTKSKRSGTSTLLNVSHDSYLFWKISGGESRVSWYKPVPRTGRHCLLNKSWDERLTLHCPRTENSLDTQTVELRMYLAMPGLLED